MFELEAWSTGEGTRDRVTVVVDGPARKVPTATAGASAAAGGEVRLAGASDAAGGGFVWTQVAGPHVVLSDSRAAAASFQPRMTGLYSFELRADDGTVIGPPATARWNAGAATAVIAGGDRLEKPGPTTLDASESRSPNGVPLGFRWQQTGGPAGPGERVVP